MFIKSQMILAPFLISLFLVVASISAAAVDDCLFEGCDCPSNSTEKYDIHCHTLEQFPRRNPDYQTTKKIESIEFQHTSLQRIPIAAFENLTVDNLYLHENNLTAINNNSFRGLNLQSVLKISEISLNEIEAGSFEPFYGKSIQLILSSMNLSNSKYDEFNKELSKMGLITRLVLSNNSLTSVDCHNFQNLTNVHTIEFTNNQIGLVMAEAFENDTSLTNLLLNDNELENLTQIFVALKPAARSLVKLDLSKNQLVDLSSNEQLSSLKKLDLSHNKIENLKETDLNGLQNLTELDLSANQISSAQIYHLKNLESLSLNENRLERVPSILELDNLKNLHLTKQDIKSPFIIEKFAFDRRISLSPISIDLDKNQNIRFDSKAFCSAYLNFSQFDTIRLPYLSMKSFNPCLLKQLTQLKPNTKKTTIEISLPEDGNTEDYSEVCSCELINAANIYGVEIKGACSNVNDIKCKDFVADDKCKTNSDFDCRLDKEPQISMDDVNEKPGMTRKSGGVMTDMSEFDSASAPSITSSNLLLNLFIMAFIYYLF